ncbi:hypothetical protein ABZ260_12455, partial [Streptosporangium sp. NPDC006013]|uniref:hypothetical protein n=1 Tax=Streptosporangium sp. NPDC006013 TaxID=3155596 RepID=UPI0033B04302
ALAASAALTGTGHENATYELHALAARPSPLPGLPPRGRPFAGIQPIRCALSAPCARRSG